MEVPALSVGLTRRHPSSTFFFRSVDAFSYSSICFFDSMNTRDSDCFALLFFRSFTTMADDIPLRRMNTGGSVERQNLRTFSGALNQRPKPISPVL